MLMERIPLLTRGRVRDMGECIIKDGCLEKYDNGKDDVLVVVPEGVERLGTDFYSKTVFEYGSAVKVLVLPKSIKEITKSALKLNGDWRIICLSEDYDFLAEYTEYYGAPAVFYTVNPNAKEGKYRRAYNYEYGAVVRIEPDEFIVKDGTLIAYLGTDPCPVIPEGVTSVASYAFVTSPTVREIVLPSTVTKLESHAFYHARSLEKIVLPDGLSRIPESCFRECAALREVVMPDSITTIENYAFQGCSAMERLTLPAHLREVAYNVFGGCASLKSVSIPEEVESIGEYAFCGCKALTEVSLPDSVRVLKREAFYGCNALAEVSLGKVEEIAYGVFRNDTALRLVRMSPALKQMGNAVFDGCSALEAVTIPEGLTCVTNSFFDKTVTTLTLPDSVTVIEDYAFSGFPSLTEIYLPARLQKIGEHAFGNCSKLETVHFGNANVWLGEGAFSGAASPLRIYYPGSAENWKKITAPRIEGRNKSYDSGSNGGAPGLSWDDYKVFPLGHRLENSFSCEVICAEDGETLLCEGSVPSRFVRSHSPYDSD